MAMAAQLSENSRQGFEGIKAGLCLASMEAKSNAASGMPVCLWQNGIRSRSSGKERDQETGLDYFLARYYSGAQGRFTSPDPMNATLLHVINPQRWNMYAYAVNNPLAYVDPDGKDAVVVNFSKLAVGLGHWGIISVNRDGSATFAEFGPRGGSKPFYPGDYRIYALKTKIAVGANGIPSVDTFNAIQSELAATESQPQDSISLAYFKTTDSETASLNAYIDAAREKEQKGNVPFYFVGFSDCVEFVASGLNAAGQGSKDYSLNISPNLVFDLLLRPNAAANHPSKKPKKPKKPKEEVTVTIDYEEIKNSKFE
jgi:RHS repeat-associated protein